MNAKLTSFAIISALFASSALASQPAGRDSIYAEASATFPSAKTAAVAATSRGRGSVYANESAAPTAKDKVQVVAAARPGRA